MESLKIHEKPSVSCSLLINLELFYGFLKKKNHSSHQVMGKNMPKARTVTEPIIWHALFHFRIYKEYSR